ECRAPCGRGSRPTAHRPRRRRAPRPARPPPSSRFPPARGPRRASAPRPRRTPARRGWAGVPPPPRARRPRARAVGRARTYLKPLDPGYSWSAAGWSGRMSQCFAAMPLPKEISFVTFDVYGTLIDWETGAYDAFAKEAEKDGYTLSR